jgi:hypothetical protein
MRALLGLAGLALWLSQSKAAIQRLRNWQVLQLAGVATGRCCN